jgi:hypothetical protein
MDLKITSRYTLTTDHPASHYGLGVLVDNEDGQKTYGPANDLPIDPKAQSYFGDDAHYTAGDLVETAAKSKLWRDDEIVFIHKFLSQNPDKANILPSDIDLRKEQSVVHLRDVMGDVSQGVHEVFWTLGYAQVAADMYTATNGKYSVRFSAGVAVLTDADTGKDVS